MRPDHWLDTAVPSISREDLPRSWCRRHPRRHFERAADGSIRIGTNESNDYRRQRAAVIRARPKSNKGLRATVSLIVTKERSARVFAERLVLQRAGVDASQSAVRSVTWLQHLDVEGALDADDIAVPAVLSGSLRDLRTLLRKRHSSVYVV